MWGTSPTFCSRPQGPGSNNKLERYETTVKSMSSQRRPVCRRCAHAGASDQVPVTVKETGVPAAPVAVTV